jgi:hypothetical protein
MIEMEKFTYFWQSGSPFSQWHKKSFVIDNIEFNCAEQYMMYGKAKLFRDEEIANQILLAKTPKEQKALGRKVRNFKPEIWEEKSHEIVYKGNHAKFTQNEDLLKKLLATKGATLVEASPYDKIWGIGLEENDPRAKNRSTWLGENRLGEILTKLRDDLLSEKR